MERARQVKPKIFRHKEAMIRLGYEADRWRWVRIVTEARFVAVDTEVI